MRHPAVIARARVGVARHVQFVFIADTLRAISPHVANAGALLMDPENGLRATLEIDELARFEFAACHASEAVKRVLPDTPVLANTGVKHATVADVLRVADGCIVGSALKYNGNTWNPIDPDRAADFMAKARAARGGK